MRYYNETLLQLWVTGRTNIIIHSLQMKQLGSIVLKDLSKATGLLNDKDQNQVLYSHKTLKERAKLNEA